jgi:hypothetical protein
MAAERQGWQIDHSAFAAFGLKLANALFERRDPVFEISP